MEKYLLKDGTELAYASTGEGRPVIFLHGWTGEALQYWGDIMPQIAAAGYQAIGLDQRGSGQTSVSKTKPVVQELWVDDLHDFIEGNHLEDVTLVGSSMGATTSMQYVRKYGNAHLHAIVFVDQCPRITKTEGWDLGMMRGEYTLEEGLAAYEVMKQSFFEYYKGFAIAMDPTVQEKPADEFEAYVRELMTHFHPDECADLFYDSQFADSRDALPLIQVPVGYFYGDPGSLYKTEVADYYKEVISTKVTSVPFPSTNHLFFIDMPDAFAKELLKFLAEN